VGEGVRGVRECSSRKQIFLKTSDFLPYHLEKHSMLDHKFDGIFSSGKAAP
jgi:hypothetical protein